MKAYVIALRTGKKYTLSKTSLTFGRNTENNIVLKEPYISRNHCRIFFQDDHFFLEDLNTTNGTYLNSIRIKEAVKLKNNDTISLYYDGPIFQFRYENENQNSYSKSEIERHDLKLALKQFFFEKIHIIGGIGVIFFLSIILFVIFLSQKAYIEQKEKKVKREINDLMNKHGEKNIVLENEMIEKIQKYINKYQNDNTLIIGLKNRERYIGVIEEVFHNNNIPVDLSYIAFVESNYDPLAYNSSSGARGLWQLMPETAKQYGLIVNRNIDERIDPVKSTHAAAAYIKDLVSIFGIDSFLLAIAAYNAGDGTMRLSLTRIQNPVTDRNFLYLYNHNLLPNETKEFVLKVLSLMILCENYNIINENEKDF